MSRSSSTERLTRARIVAAVTDLLEHGGVDAVSTRTIGEALDVHPTALYRHFRDMDELLREAADGILAGIADGVGDLAGGAGQADGAAQADGTVDALHAVAELCRRLRAVLMSHPGAAQVMASGPARMPNERALTEKMLGLLSEAGLPDAEVTLAYHAVIEYVVGSAAIDTAGTADSSAEVEARHRVWRAAYFAAPPDEFPHTTRLAALLYPSLDEQFEFGIEALIAGLRQRVTSRTSGCS